MLLYSVGLIGSVATRTTATHAAADCLAADPIVCSINLGIPTHGSSPVQADRKANIQTQALYACRLSRVTRQGGCVCRETRMDANPAPTPTSRAPALGRGNSAASD